jgi:hypothetical protein
MYRSCDTNVLINNHTPILTGFLRQIDVLISKTTQSDLHCISKHKLNRNINMRNTVVINQSQIFLNNYTTLKSGSNLRLYKLDNRKSMPIVKNLTRLSYRQYRYIKIF